MNTFIVARYNPVHNSVIEAGALYWNRLVQVQAYHRIQPATRTHSALPVDTRENLR